MSLRPGERLGAYEIVSLIGAGGMGEVYRARDTRLHRDVALKILPPKTTDHPSAFARFEREAQAVAALSHPNILAVHDLGKTDAVSFVVFELLEGATLRERLAGGPLPVRKAIDYARQVADGLAAAHARGITHRDIKPDNLFVTDEGRVKILDFGLAQTAPFADDSHGATMAAAPPVTDAGTVLGTLGYMAPEQVRGLAVDARADLFALGAVLYEMCTGQRAFSGATPADTMTAVLSSDPPELTLSGQSTPPALDRIVRRCLEKQPAERFQSARDLSFALDALSSLSGPARDGSGAVPAARRTWWVPVAVVAVVALAAGLLAGRRLWPATNAGPTSAAAPMLRAEFESPTSTISSLLIGLSPDGRYLVHPQPTPGTGQNELVIRDLGTGDSTIVPESAAGSGAAWSPRGDAFVFGRDLGLRRFTLGDRATSLVTHLGGVSRGRAWLADDTIVFASPDGLRRVAVGGGTVTTIVQDPAAVFVGPSPIGSRTDYVLALRTSSADSELRHVVAIRLSDGQVTDLVQNDAVAVFATPGYLLLPRPNGLFAAPFDARRLVLAGETALVGAPVVWDGPSGVSSVSASEAGVIAFRPARDAPLQFEWLDPVGRPLGVVGPPAFYASFSLARDGQRIVVRQASADGGRTTTVIDLARGVSSPVTTHPGLISDPVWIADGTRILYRTEDGLMAQSPYGSTPEVVRQERVYPDAVSGDGRWLIGGLPSDAGIGFGLFVMAANGQGERQPISVGPFASDEGSFSPDGRLISYQSDRSGRQEIYVAPFPLTSERWQVSSEGGVQARWSPDARALYYINLTGQLMRVSMPASGPAQAGRPQAMFDLRVGVPSSTLEQYTVHGDRFLVLRRAAASLPQTIVVLGNWTSAIAKRAADR